MTGHGHGQQVYDDDDSEYDSDLEGFIEDEEGTKLCALLYTLHLYYARHCFTVLHFVFKFVFLMLGFF